MGNDDEAVVDSDGRVHGLLGLRVIDASIMPKMITANLNAAVIMMAEKLADVVRGCKPLQPFSPSFFEVSAGSLTPATAALTANTTPGLVVEPSLNLA
jgi:choline dehydrogenase